MTCRPIQPSDTHQGTQRERGFTLLELLISMTLFLLIVVILGGALRLGFRSISAAEKKMDRLERFRTSASIITTQLQSSAPLTYNEDGEKKYYFKGDASSLQFATQQSVRGGENGCVIVSYRLETTSGDTLALYASERLVSMEDVQEIKLFDDLKALSFSYFSRDATEEEGKWTEKWSDNNRYPERLRVNITRDGGEEKLLIPLYARIIK